MARSHFACAGVCALALVMPAGAAAQAFRSNPTFSLGGTTAPVEQPDIAYDSNNNRYLQVSGKVFIEAHLLDAAGNITRTFNVTNSGLYAMNPRVAFSPHVGGSGGYLVTWHAVTALGGDTGVVRGRLFNAAGDPLTAEFVISTSVTHVSVSSQWTMGAPAAYSTTSQEFLVVWGGNKYTTADVLAQRVNTVGTLLGDNFLLSAGTANLYDRDPSVAWSPATNKFTVGWGIYNESGRFGYATARTVQAGTGALGTQYDFPFGSVGVEITSMAYNPTAHQFLFTWYNQTASGRFHAGALLDANGNPADATKIVSAIYSAYDALDVEFNTLAGEYFLVTHSQSHEDAGVTILANGSPYDNGILVTSTTGVNGNFHPRLATSTLEKKWLVVTASQFAYTSAQFVVSGSTGGGTQTPSCTFTLSSPGASFSPLGGGGGFSVAASAGDCAWTASSSSPWLSVTTSGGTGGGSISFTVAQNPSTASRTGSVTVAGKTYTVSQSGRTLRASVNDINGDGRSDLLWFNASTRQTAIWALSGPAVLETRMLNGGVAAGAGWAPKGAGDLNGDGYADVVWQHTDGRLAAWLMQGTTFIADPDLLFQSGAQAQNGPGWELAAIGDLNGDGSADLIWQDVNGGLAAWMMNGITAVDFRFLSVPGVDPSWRVAGAGDINGDGRADIIFQHTGGWMAAWLMNGTQVVGSNYLSAHMTHDPAWKLRGVGDVNGDGYADLLWQHTTGFLAVWYLNTFNVTYGSYLSIPRVADLNWQAVGPG